VCRILSCRAIRRTRRSGSVSFVATRRIRSDTSAVGLSGLKLLGMQTTVDALGDASPRSGDVAVFGGTQET